MPSSFYPQNIDALAAWFANFTIQFAALAAKYGLSASVSAVQKDNLWIQYWVPARHEADNQKQGLTKFFNAIAGNDPTLAPPSSINWSLPPAPPSDVAPGIEFRVRQLARDIKGSTKYSEADGELLGIVSPEKGDENLDQLTTEFTLRTLANFELQATFRKRGMDALKFQFRHKGGDWRSAGFLITSPGTLAIPPTTPGRCRTGRSAGDLYA